MCASERVCPYERKRDRPRKKEEGGDREEERLVENL